MSIQIEITVPNIGDDPLFPIPATVTECDVSWGERGERASIDREMFEKLCEAVMMHRAASSAVNE